MNPCLCCGARLLAPLTYRDGFLSRPLRQCTICGHVQVESTPESATLKAYYAAAYSHSRAEQVSKGRGYGRLMERRAAAQLDFCAAHLPLAGRRLLDLGCGYGATLHSAQMRGAIATGLEFDPRTVEYGRINNLDIRLVSSEEDLTERVREINPDLVILSHALEHFLDPETLLSACQTCLVFIEVPAYDASIAEQFLDQEGHLNFFQQAGLEYFLRRVGFDILRLGSFGPGQQIFWQQRWKWLKRTMQLVSRDYFINQYAVQRNNGIWLRVLVKGDACRL